MSVSYHRIRVTPGFGAVAALLVGRDESCSHRKSYEASQIPDAEPFHDRAAVGFNSLHAQAKPGGYLLGRVSLGDEPENLPLPHGEKIERRG